MTKKALFFFIVGIGFVSSCTQRNEQDLRGEQPPCSVEEVDYRLDIKPLISSSCGLSGCHNGPNSVGGLNLNEDEDIKRIAQDGQLLNRITGNNVNIMPPPPSNPLPDCEIQKVQAWLAEGAPQ